MLYREVIALCSENHMQYVIALGGKKVEFLNLKPGGTQSNWWVMLLHHQVHQFGSGVDVSQTFHLHHIEIMQLIYITSSLHLRGL